MITISSIQYSLSNLCSAKLTFSCSVRGLCFCARGRADAGTRGRGTWDAGTWERGNAGTWGRRDAGTRGREDFGTRRRAGIRGRDKQVEKQANCLLTTDSL